MPKSENPSSSASGWTTPNNRAASLIVPEKRMPTDRRSSIATSMNLISLSGTRTKAHVHSFHDIIEMTTKR